MIQRLLACLAVVIVFLCLSGGTIWRPVYAADVLSPVCDNVDPANGGTPTVCQDAKNAKTGAQSGSNPLVGPHGLLTTYIHILALVVGFGAVFVIMLAGLRFITSNGEPQAVASARGTILYAIVGLVVAVLAQAVVTFVLGKVK